MGFVNVYRHLTPDMVRINRKSMDVPARALAAATRVSLLAGGEGSFPPRLEAFVEAARETMGFGAWAEADAGSVAKAKG
jgi:hypothetical protein